MGKQEFRSLALGAVCLFIAASAAAFTSPRDGGPLPQGYFDAKAKDPRAFTAPHAWVQKAERLRTEREAYLAKPGSLPNFAAGNFAVADTFRVPVLPSFYIASEQALAPVSAANLQKQLFGANATGNVTDYYHEVSYNQLTVTGDVYSNTQLAHDHNYYAGSCNGTDPGCARTGEMLKEILDARDGTVNFAKYDNDGPDGVPNSGDDDGYVDAVVFVQGLPGGECGTNNIISHTWSYTAWSNSGGLPYTTNDARHGGGNIKIDTYVIMPALNCGATSPYTSDEYIDIGVLCHELGHTMGLPDLYDVNGGGSGIGHWGIMGSGNWNTPEKPAHMDAWCKKELGWTTPVQIGWQPAPVAIKDAEEYPDVYRLPFDDERFRRSTTCAIAGSYSLYCGFTAAEAATHGFASAGPGYGSNWYQTIEHTFHYKGSGSVNFQYAYTGDMENGYDFAKAIISVNGVETVLKQYTGTSNGSENVPITGYLAPLAGAGGDYTIKFRFVSDLSFDDSDGQNATTCGAFAVDNVNVNGGGVTYTTGFETSADGWHINPSETLSAEYWLVENRKKVGFDVNLHGEGLLIWHVDDEMLHAPLLINRGNNNGPRGLVLEEAEGVFDLNGTGFNMGEAADPYPGTSGNTSFTSASVPNSNDNLDRPTQIQVTSIGPAGATMNATLRAGNPGPIATSIAPNAIDNDQTSVLVTVTGSRIRYGATFKFSITQKDLLPRSIEWLDDNTIRATLNTYTQTPGQWNLVVTNPDGQTFTLPNALTLNSVLAARVVSANVDVINSGVRLRYTLFDQEPGETISLLRANGTASDFAVIRDKLDPVSGNNYEYVDRSVEPGHSYSYLLESRAANGDVSELHRATAVIPAASLVLEQNVPNPFNPRTVIGFYLPARTSVHLDVYDVRGALVKRIASGVFDSGSHSIEWDGTDSNNQGVASGFYVYRLVTDGHPAMTRKMMLLK
ncbi:MAG TPA: M6 family metalloprotease domain-containing protein [Candidatus Krumholzibacteria bacterium]|nr:M6 family metalloprotease domain-containing protein [Candidatus Krumholzibacteria bacterium]